MINPVINLDGLDYVDFGHGEGFACRIGDLSQRLGAQKLGYNLTVIPPGKRAFPFHNHHVNEEMFFILEGTGELRLGADVHPLRAGDVVACPTGGPETAHQIRNTGEVDLKFLAISTQQSPEICEYPDSGKFAFRARLETGADGAPRELRHVDREGTSLDYWDGEH
jgi:uncharacterized cupin superfamily protein